MFISSLIVKIAKTWRFPVCTKISKMTIIASVVGQNKKASKIELLYIYSPISLLYQQITNLQK